jgi:hypothetical protein
VLGDLSLSTNSGTIGNSGTLDIGSGSSASGLGGSIAISVLGIVAGITKLGARVGEQVAKNTKLK